MGAEALSVNSTTRLGPVSCGSKQNFLSGFPWDLLCGALHSGPLSRFLAAQGH